jgi:hypothetical protein
MRVLVLVLALVAAGPMRGAHAQTRPDDPLSPARVDPLALATAYKRAQQRRNIGIGLAVPGLALQILGSVLIGYGINNLSGPRPTPAGAGEEIGGGAAAGLLGLAIGIPGIVLWILGQDDMDVVTWRNRQLAAP